MDKWTDPSEKTLTNSSFVPRLATPESSCGHIARVRSKLVESGTCGGRAEWTSRVAQSEKKSGSSIMQPQIRKTPSTVVVNRIGPELSITKTDQSLIFHDGGGVTLLSCLLGASRLCGQGANARRRSGIAGGRPWRCRRREEGCSRA